MHAFRIAKVAAVIVAILFPIEKPFLLLKVSHRDHMGGTQPAGKFLFHKQVAYIHVFRNRHHIS